MRAGKRGEFVGVRSEADKITEGGDVEEVGEGGKDKSGEEKREEEWGGLKVVKIVRKAEGVERRAFVEMGVSRLKTEHPVLAEGDF